MNTPDLPTMQSRLEAWSAQIRLALRNSASQGAVGRGSGAAELLLARRDVETKLDRLRRRPDRTRRRREAERAWTRLRRRWRRFLARRGRRR